MIQKQLTNIESLIYYNKQETIPVAKFISDVMACAMNSGNILCFTMANFGLMPFLPAGTPHCILSNIAAILILDKLDYLGRRDIIKIKDTKVSNKAEEIEYKEIEDKEIKNNNNNENTLQNNRKKLKNFRRGVDSFDYDNNDDNNAF
jgi:hypothetical protein